MSIYFDDEYENLEMTSSCCSCAFEEGIETYQYCIRSPLNPNNENPYEDYFRIKG